MLFGWDQGDNGEYISFYTWLVVYWQNLIYVGNSDAEKNKNLLLGRNMQIGSEYATYSNFKFESIMIVDSSRVGVYNYLYLLYPISLEKATAERWTRKRRSSKRTKERRRRNKRKNVRIYTLLILESGLVILFLLMEGMRAK